MRAHPEACASFRPGGYLSGDLEPLCGRCGLRVTAHRRPPRRRRRRRVLPSRAGAVHAMLAPIAVLVSAVPVLMGLAELVRRAS